MVSRTFSLLSACLLLVAPLIEAVPAPAFSVPQSARLRSPKPPQLNRVASASKKPVGQGQGQGQLPFIPSTGPFQGSGFLKVYSARTNRWWAEHGVELWKPNGWVTARGDWTRTVEDAELFHATANKETGLTDIRTSDGHYCHDADGYLRCDVTKRPPFSHSFEGDKLISIHWSREPKNHYPDDEPLFTDPSKSHSTKIMIEWFPLPHDPRTV